MRKNLSLKNHCGQLESLHICLHDERKVLGVPLYSVYVSRPVKWVSANESGYLYSPFPVPSFYKSVSFRFKEQKSPVGCLEIKKTILI